ncbi:MAG: MerR family DNA-binding protein [Steroidobacteraceae bacterium]
MAAPILAGFGTDVVSRRDILCLHQRGGAAGAIETANEADNRQSGRDRCAAVGELLSLYRVPHRASKDVKRLALAHVAEVEIKIAELTAIRDTIADLARRCHGDQRPECPILDELEAAAH